jgi:tetratricopeptide (TPR) repeat protein
MHLQEGLFLLLNNDPKNAVVHLQEAGKMQDTSMILLLGALEKQLGVQLVKPIEEASLSETIDISEKLFLARRYEEAIAALDNPKTADEMNRRGHCHAMLGQLDDALAWYDQADLALREESSFFAFDQLEDAEANFFLKRRLAHLLAGDLDGAKRSEETSSYDDEVQAFKEFCAIPLNLAIQWLEQQK